MEEIVELEIKLNDRIGSEKIAIHELDENRNKMYGRKISLQATITAPVTTSAINLGDKEKRRPLLAFKRQRKSEDNIENNNPK